MAGRRWALRGTQHVIEKSEMAPLSPPSNARLDGKAESRSEALITASTLRFSNIFDTQFRRPRLCHGKPDSWNLHARSGPSLALICDPQATVLVFDRGCF